MSEMVRRILRLIRGEESSPVRTDEFTVALVDVGSNPFTYGKTRWYRRDPVIDVMLRWGPEGEVCGAKHPDAEEDPKNYGDPCDYPKDHGPIPDDEGNEWDHGWMFEGKPSGWWNGYLGEPVALAEKLGPIADPWNPESPDYLVLPNPFGLQGNAKVCNEPYVVNGWTMGYCDKVAKKWGKRAGTHRGDHKLTWKSKPEPQLDPGHVGEERD